MPRRPCIECGTPTEGSRCPAHQLPPRTGRRDPERRRINYGHQHQQARVALAATLPAPCWYCGVMVYNVERWVAAHTVDGDPASERVVSHPTCNAKARGPAPRVGGH